MSWRAGAKLFREMWPLIQRHVSQDDFRAESEFEVHGACPVQAFGKVSGRELYFRARHGVWTFDVADSAGNLPSDGYFDSDGFFREGVDPHHGYMPLPKAVAVIAECLREYTGIRPER